jgi:DNA-binding MarR family transcriptional regulator
MRNYFFLKSSRGFHLFPEVIRRFKITYAQHAIYECIFYLSTSNPKFEWCKAHKTNIARYCALSGNSIYKAIEVGIKKGLIERNSRTPRFIRTTTQYNDIVIALKDESVRHKNKQLSNKSNNLVS